MIEYRALQFIVDNYLMPTGIDGDVYFSVTQSGNEEYFEAPGKLISLTIEEPTEISYTNNQSVEIYPNPAQNYFLINKNCDFYIYDLYGKIKKSKKNYISNSKVYLNKFEKGIYFIKIHTNNNINSIKLYVK